MIRYWIVCLAFFLGACSAAKRAEKSFENGEYNSAILMYEKSAKPDDPEMNFKLAEAYRKSNRIDDAEPYYLASLNGGIQEESANYYYAASLKANQKFDQAKKVLEDYVSKIPQVEHIGSYKSALQASIQGLEHEKKAVLKPLEPGKTNWH